MVGLLAVVVLPQVPLAVEVLGDLGRVQDVLPHDRLVGDDPVDWTHPLLQLAVQGRAQVTLAQLQRTKEMFYLTTHSTHFIHNYMGRKGNEMFYLTTHSTHFIHNYMGRKGNVLFNDALNPFYSQLYGKERKCFI